MREKQLDLAKLDYLISNNTLNQLTQHYFSSQLPELSQVPLKIVYNLKVFKNCVHDLCLHFRGYLLIEIELFYD